jgi:hypothetical protein
MKKTKHKFEAFIIESEINKLFTSKLTLKEMKKYFDLLNLFKYHFSLSIQDNGREFKK